MKKKLLLLAVMIIAVISVFAITASAVEFGTVTVIPEFTPVEGLDTTSRVLMDDGITYPSAYVFKNTREMSLGALNSATGKEYTVANIVAMEYPEGCTYVDGSFHSSKTLQYVYFSSTITSFRWASFYQCTSLSEVVFAKNSTITAINTDAFYGNTALTVLKLPNSLESVSDNFLRASSNLRTIYFGASFKGFKGTTGDNFYVRGAANVKVYFPGTEAGNSVANLVFGNSVPCGKLTMSFPHNVGQCPVYYNHFLTGNYRTDDTKRMVFVSGYIDGPNKPLYPFGYGLSYTEFEYSEHKISSDTITENGKITASVKVKNIGKFKGKEIVQMYIQDLFGSVVRPIKELRGFKKIELMPNEERVVEFEITEDTLAFVGADQKRKAEKGRFRIFIGKDSETEPFAEFELI